MSIEECIEILKNLILMPENWIIEKSYKGKYDFIGTIEGNLAIKTLLKAYEDGKADLYEANKAISNLLDLLKEKENIIDAMAEQLTTPVHNKEWIIKYFEKEANNDR